MKMQFKKGKIEGVIIEQLTKFSDDRGYLVETFRIDNLPSKLRPVMSYVSYTKPGIARGPHEHMEQTDIFCFMGPGNFKIRLWDNRKEYESYGNFMELIGGKDKDYYKKLITFIKDRPGHDRRYAVNCNKIKQELGWKQEVDVEEVWK